MKFRRIVPLISLILLLSILTGCKSAIDKSRDYINEHQPSKPEGLVTLNLYLPSEGEIPQDDVNAMQDQFNAVIATKYNTQVVFHLIPQEQYDAVLEEKLDAAYQNNLKTDEDPTRLPFAGEAQTVTDADGVVRRAYPDETAVQLDIFAVTSLEKLTTAQTKYAALQDLSDFVLRLSSTGARQGLSKVIFDNAYVTNSETGEKTYPGVPANFIVGEYRYLFLSKNCIEAARSAILSAAKNARDTFKDPDADAQRAAEYQELCEIISALEIRKFPEAVLHTNNLNLITETVDNFYNRYPDDKPAEPYRFETGDYRLRESAAGEYEICVVSYPNLNRRDIFTGMYCVSAFCANTDRAIQVLEELNTNPRLHTILQFGADGIHYTTSNDAAGNPVITPTAAGARYQMNLRYTGNAACLYACPARQIDSEYGRYLILQNNDAVYNG